MSPTLVRDVSTVASFGPRLASHIRKMLAEHLELVSSQIVWQKQEDRMKRCPKCSLCQHMQCDQHPGLPFGSSSSRQRRAGILVWLSTSPKDLQSASLQQTCKHVWLQSFPKLSCITLDQCLEGLSCTKTRHSEDQVRTGKRASGYR